MLHDEHEIAAVDNQIVEGNDARVVEASNHLCFAA